MEHIGSIQFRNHWCFCEYGKKISLYVRQTNVLT